MSESQTLIAVILLFFVTFLVVYNYWKNRRYFYNVDASFHYGRNEISGEAQLKLQVSLSDARTQMPISYNKELTEKEFERIIKNKAKEIARIKRVDSFQNGKIYAVVSSKSGLSTWRTLLDFNDWGHITGNYIVIKENDDSIIPNVFGDSIKKEILELYSRNNRSIINYSYYAELFYDTWNEVSRGFSLFKKPEKCISSFFKNEMIGEHVFVVAGILRNDGFKNIHFYPVKDIDYNSNAYLYQTAIIKIAGHSDYSENAQYNPLVPIDLYYHKKKEIELTRKQLLLLKNMSSNNVIYSLHKIGFSNVEKSEVKNIIRRHFWKNRPIKRILIHGPELEQQIEKGRGYLYDSKITIEYYS